MGWHCVHIEHIRVAKAVSATFRNMLLEAYRNQGSPRDCHVYFNPAPSGYFYYFSPAAAQSLETFMNFWAGFAVPEPTNVHKMEKVI